MYLICTPLFYPNDKPHIGHRYNASLSAMYARLLTFLGQNQIILTGTDEHGEKVYKSYLDFIIKSNENKRFTFSDYLQMRREQFDGSVFKLLGKFFPYYTDLAIHRKYVNNTFEKLVSLGKIYKGEYKGYYSIREERYIGADEYKDLSDEEKSLFVRERYESGYFFALEQSTKDLICKSLDRIIVNENLIEYTRQIVSKAEDVFITRQANEDVLKHSIKIESDSNYVLYVWFEAVQYYNAILRTYNHTNVKPIIIIGKDILFFHSSLLSHISYNILGYLPYRLIVHGLINDANNLKVSKSYKNTVTTEQLEVKYGPILFSYLLSCGIKNDIQLSEESLMSYENFLRNNVRNCYKRYFSLFDKYIPHIREDWANLFVEIFDCSEQKYIADLYININNDEIMTDGADIFKYLIDVSSKANLLITKHELWSVTKDKSLIFCILGNYIRTMMIFEEILGVPGIQKILKMVGESTYSSIMVPMKIFECSSLDIKNFDL